MRPEPSFSFAPNADDTTDGDLATGERLLLAGPLLVSTIAAIDPPLRGLDGPIVAIDIAGVEDIDTAGAWLVLRLSRAHGADITGASSTATRLIAAVDRAQPGEAMVEATLPWWMRGFDLIGRKVVGAGEATIAGLSFFGAVLVTMAGLVRHPRRFRPRALVHQMELVGVDSLFIIALMSFLIGIVIAQQGAVQLQQFGAEIYTINLTGRLAMRELGVLMTAIMLAGRSGSAFAAQIGTMKLTEEIDAMRTIGVSPLEALVVPRVLAAVLMLPLLGFFSSIVSIIGGAVLGQATLDLPFLTFITRCQEVVPLSDLWVGLVKGPVFGLIIALTGCYQGMRVEGNSEEVGLRTTLAVVQAIFMVIVLDAFFAVFFTAVGWK